MVEPAIDGLESELRRAGIAHRAEVQPFERQPADSIRGLALGDDGRHPDVRGEQGEAASLGGEQGRRVAARGFDKNAPSVGQVEAAGVVHAAAADRT